MGKTEALAFHVVLSPRECPNIQRFVQYLSKIDARYVVSYEYGANMHKHIDAYVVLKKEMRQDHFRRAILKLYPHIPEEERKNCKVMVNNADPDERYGFGYSLKEDQEKYSNLSIEYQTECLQYFIDNRQRVSRLIKELKVNSSFDVNDVANGLVDFVTAYFKTKTSFVTYEWLIEEYLMRIKDKLQYSVYAKLNEEKLLKFVKIKMGKPMIFEDEVGDGLLTVPHPSPVSIQVQETSHVPLQ